MFKQDKSLIEQLVGWDAGLGPIIMSVLLKSGQLAAMVGVIEYANDRCLENMILYLLLFDSVVQLPLCYKIKRY